MSKMADLIVDTDPNPVDISVLEDAMREDLNARALCPTGTTASVHNM